MTADILDAALELHAAGYSVLPIRADGSKAPAVTWKPFITERADEAQVRAWFDGTDHGLAVVQGAVSGNAELVELEGRAVDALPALAALAADTGLGDLWARLGAGWVERSPSGGFHWHYRLEGDVPGNTKLARRPSTPEELTAAPGARIQVLAETRGHGGYVVVAPTPGTHHPSGQPWVRLVGGPNNAPTLTRDERDAFHALLRTLDAQDDRPETPKSAPVAPHDPTAGITPGDDYENKTDWTDILTPYGWTLVSTRGRTRYWLRPGKEHGRGEPWSATTGHAPDRDRLFVWSTSTEFDAEVPYTKLGALAVLEHGGDHAAAAKALRARGFGSHPTLRALPGGLDGLIANASAQTDGATALAPQPEPVSDSQDEPDDDTLPPSWRPINLTPYLDGTWTPAEPTMLVRTDSIALLYPGLVHDFHGESESGKSLVVQAEAAAQVRAGNPVLYVDFESDAGQVAARMLAFGCTPETLIEHFTYVRPDMSPHALAELEAWAALLARPFTLAVLDGVTDALGQFGAASKENDDIAAWHRAVPRTLATRTGAAVVLIDHVVKATEGRGRFAIGGQTKMAAIDGASYLVEVDKPLGKGLAGTVVLRIGKDRPGSIRPQCGTWRALDRTQEAARITIDSTGGNGSITVTVAPPDSHVGDTRDNGPFRPTGLMERASRLLETMREPVSLNKLMALMREDGTKAKNGLLAEAVNLLVNSGHVAEEDGPRNARLLRSTSAYRQRNDPQSDAYQPPLDGLIPTSSDLSPEQDGRSAIRQNNEVDTTSPHLSPTSPRRGESTSPHHLPPVGEVGEVDSAHSARPLPTALFGIKDPATGLHVNPTTGEVIA
ncbi:bifunctional DNA primase/polymerase [Cellulosimicrobium terreum]|nr:bifunctional DNA primase/polymerase [Cellulosimicrobium terreum]